MIKYLGSKRVLVPTIVQAIEDAAGAAGAFAQNGAGRTVLDPFSGTARVGHALKRHGWRVIAGDHNAYAHVLACCYVQADADTLRHDAELLVQEFNRLAMSGLLTPGWFSDLYSGRSRYFRPENGVRIEAVREAIAAKSLEPELEAVMLTSLMEAADRVDSTVGVQMAYLKNWSPRSANALELRVPNILPRAHAGKGLAILGDAYETVVRHSADAAVTYLDPPYNQHSYLGNYHVWETLVRWDRPPTFGVACKREDCRTRRSGFNFKNRAANELRQIVAAVRSPALVISFSDEGFISREELVEIIANSFNPPTRSCSPYRPCAVPVPGERPVCIRMIAIGHRRYVGARIGIYNPRGEKVGQVGKLTNTECVYIAHGSSEFAKSVQIPAKIKPMQEVGCFVADASSPTMAVRHDFLPEMAQP